MLMRCRAELGGLSKIARLDTTVTVVDAFRFFSEFETDEFLTDRFGRDEVPEEDERTISELFAEQIEFADVVVVNKIDLVDKGVLERIRTFVRTLNRKAKIIECKRGKLDVKELLATGRFDLSEAVQSAGWLHSIKDTMAVTVNGSQRQVPKPETLE